jgi:hypothetical protein
VRLVLALAVAAPMLLGPALSPLVSSLAGDVHLCACGMKAGTCGCPECEMQEHARLRERAPRAYPVLRGPCSPENLALRFAPLPAATPAGLAPLLLPSPSSQAPSPEPPLALSIDPAEPSSPPPRSFLS